MNDIEYRILRAQAGKGPDPDYSDPAVLEIAAALVDAKLVRGDVVRAFEPIPPGVTLGELTHAGLEALDAEERAREERKVLARLATRGDRLLMAVLAALVVLLVQRWLAPEVAPCRCGREREEQHGEDSEQEVKSANVPPRVLELPAQGDAGAFRNREVGLERFDPSGLPLREITNEFSDVELALPDVDGDKGGEGCAPLVE